MMKYINISIHALLTESDLVVFGSDCRNKNFYPRSPYGERPEYDKMQGNPKLFLSTLSLRRATERYRSAHLLTTVFLSTLSLRRATLKSLMFLLSSTNFYPRSPYGERLRYRHISFRRFRFLSTLSLRRATRKPCAGSGECCISIHALLTESDVGGDV